jgi:hypothetical protein
MKDTASQPVESPGHPVKAAVQSWNRFWFSPADPTPLGLMRICCGLVAFYVVLAYSVDLQELFGEDAWINHQAMEELRHELPFVAQPSQWMEMENVRRPPANEKEYEAAKEFKRKWMNTDPRRVAGRGYPIWSVWFHVTDPTWMVGVHITILVILMLFTLGVGTRVTSVLAWLGVISYTQRAPTTLFGMDTMMNILMIYLMIGPSGSAFSVDRLIARYWASWRAWRTNRPGPVNLKPAPSVSANLAIRLLQIHLCIIYLSAGLSKLKGNAWWQGTAIWGTLANYEFSPMHWPFFLGFLRFLAQNRFIWEILMTGGVIFTLMMEIGFPFLVWIRRLRWVMLGMAATLHTGIAVLMGLNTFSLFMLTLLISFVPLEAISWLIQVLGRGAPALRLGCNQRLRGQVRAASLIRTFDVWNQVDIGEAERLELVTENNEVVRGFALFEHLVYSLRMLWPLAPATWLLRVTGLGRLWFPSEVETPGLPLSSENGKPHSTPQQRRESHRLNNS